MQKKFEVAVNLAQDFTDAEKAQARQNINALGGSDSFYTNSISHTVTSAEASAGRIRIPLTVSDVASGHFDCIEKLGVTFLRLYAAANDIADLDALTSGTPVYITVGLNGQTNNSVQMLSSILVTTKTLNILDASVNCLPAFNQNNIVTVYVTFDFTPNSIPTGVSFNFVLFWNKLLH